MTRPKLRWQSKTILLVVFPFVGANVVLETHWWATQMPSVAIWTLGLSGLLGAIALQARSATAGAALGGAVITASLMFATVSFPYMPWRTALIPVFTLLLLTSVATRAGKNRKETLGTAENRFGREASQVAANLGMAALACNGLVLSWVLDQSWLKVAKVFPAVGFSIGLAALAEAAADTVSSELGQVLSGHPRMITTFREVEPGTDGAISVGGTLAGIAAAGVVSTVGAWSMDGGWRMLGLSWAAGVCGLFVDSLLGATAELRGWLNNDAVNFVSTASAAAIALGLMATMHQGEFSVASFMPCSVVSFAVWAAYVR